MRFLGLPFGLKGVVESKREEETLSVKFDNGERAIINTPQIFEENPTNQQIGIYKGMNI